VPTKKDLTTWVVVQREGRGTHDASDKVTRPDGKKGIIKIRRVVAIVIGCGHIITNDPDASLVSGEAVCDDRQNKTRNGEQKQGEEVVEGLLLALDDDEELEHPGEDAADPESVAKVAANPI